MALVHAQLAQLGGRTGTLRRSTPSDEPADYKWLATNEPAQRFMLRAAVSLACACCQTGR